MVWVSHSSELDIVPTNNPQSVTQTQSYPRRLEAPLATRNQAGSAFLRFFLHKCELLCSVCRGHACTQKARKPDKSCTKHGEKTELRGFAGMFAMYEPPRVAVCVCVCVCVFFCLLGGFSAMFRRNKNGDGRRSLSGLIRYINFVIGFHLLPPDPM